MTPQGMEKGREGMALADRARGNERAFQAILGAMQGMGLPYRPVTPREAQELLKDSGLQPGELSRGIIEAREEKMRAMGLGLPADHGFEWVSPMKGVA